MNFVNNQSKPNLTQITKSENKPIQPINSNLNHIQFPDLKTKKKKKTITKTITLPIMG